MSVRDDSDPPTQLPPLGTARLPHIRHSVTEVFLETASSPSFMRFSRKYLFDPSETNVCHCIRRCEQREMVYVSWLAQARRRPRPRSAPASRITAAPGAGTVEENLMSSTKTKPSLSHSTTSSKGWVETMPPKS